MSKTAWPDSGQILSRHRFTRPGIRLWLPLMMTCLLVACAWLTAPKIKFIEWLLILFLVYLVISVLVPICEITVVEDGLIIDRLILPERFIPWSAIDRVKVFTSKDGQEGAQLEIASIGIHEGLSLLNRLPGLLYGQGLRQTVVITPDALEDYDVLIEALAQHCTVIQLGPDR